jgi:hypothetical protein
MKQFFFLGLMIMAWIGCSRQAAAQSQTADAVIQDVVKAVRAGDANALADHFGPKLNLTIPPDAEGEFSKDQATFIFKEYFMNYPVESFSVLHKGSSASTHYIAGSYVSTKGRFDTNIFVKERNGAMVVEEIRFEKE